MKLADTVSMGLHESRVFCSDMAILEDGEGPRWQFGYDNFKTDPNPDILLLGAYQHPNTKNNLVGGINLHYLRSDQVDNLSKALPQIMAAGNLYGRYHVGKRLVPDVFTNYYRTYNAAHIRGVKQDVMYPKYGFMKTAANWIKKKIGGIFKSKEKREKENQPQYPNDLSNMQHELNKTVERLQHNPPKDVDPNTPEIQAARNAFLQYRREQQMSMQDVEKQEDEPLNQAVANYNNVQTGKIEPVQQAAIPTKTQKRRQPQAQPQPQAQQPDQKQLSKIDFDAERKKNQEELLDPNNDIDLSESITYYSPTLKRYITECISKNISW